MKKAIVLLAIACLLATSLAAASRERRLAEFREGLKAALADIEKRMATPNPTPTTRELPNAALAQLALGHDPRAAEKLVRFAYAQQDMDPNSPAFGTVPWQVGHPEVKDANAIEFTAQALGPILLHYGKSLSDEFKQEMRPHVRAAIAAIQRHKVPVTYTNIFLMKTVNLVLLGEAIGEEKAAEQGYAQLDQWIEHTRGAGIREFDSPTYYNVDLNSLMMGYCHAPRPPAREKFKRVLDFFWADITANYFPGRGTLSGPHSRDYDFLTGHGGIEFNLYQEGVRNAPAPQKVDIEKVYLLENEAAGGYRPPQRILRLASSPERVVRSRWEAGADKDRYNYITRDFSIGSSSANYGPQDKPIAIEVASTSADDVPAITIAPDLSDQPYGKLKFKDRSGHNKPVHVPLHPASVQEKGVLLVLLDLDASKEAATESLATNILLPAMADKLVVDGHAVSGRSVFEQPAKINSLAGMRAGNAGVALRMFRADGCDGQDPALVLKADSEGLRYGAARYTAYHYRGPSKKLSDRHVRVGVLFLTARCRNESDFSALMKRAESAKIEEETAGPSWSVRATVGRLRLEAARDLNTRQILYRRINGKDVPSSVLAVNGKDLIENLPAPK